MNYECTWYPFTEHPDADSCWSLSAGPDGRIYAAACAEGVPGGIVKLVRYDEEKDSLEYLFALDEMVDDPGDSGRATQCKIHYSFAPSRHDHIMYMATHLSGPPIDQPAYSPWNSWYDPERCFRGSALVAYDTRQEEVLWWDTLIPKEGCRCLLLDEERGVLYAIGYPRDHLYRYDIEKRERTDLGRIGSVNAQALFLDSHHRVWTTDDYGHLVRYDPQKDRLERSLLTLPHDMRYQTGWHSVFYDITPAPDLKSVYAVCWIGNSRLMRIWPEEGEWGRIEDLGPVTPDYDISLPEWYFADHCGGLTFSPDGMLYYVAARWQGEFPSKNDIRRVTTDPAVTSLVQGVVWRMDPDTNEREEVAILNRPDSNSQYVSRGAVNKEGDLFFGHVGPRPVGIFKVTMPTERKAMGKNVPLRSWG
jgi:hypothetical protein